MGWRKVLLSIDDPTRIEPHILGKVAQLTRALGAQIELFYSVFDARLVRPGRAPRIAESDVISRVRDARRQLEIAADSLRDQSIRVRTAVRWDYPRYAATARQVLRYKPDLLIAPLGHRTRAASATLRHSDFRLLQTCACPVLMIKADKPYSGGAVLAALDPDEATAETPTVDRAILTAASTLASALAAPMHACHAVPALLTPVAGTATLVLACAERQAAHLKGARQRTRALTADFGLPARRVHVAQGIPEWLVDSLVKETHADIVAIGSISLSNGILMGRIAERLLNVLACDVLVVKPPGYRSPVARTCIRLMPAARARRPLPAASNRSFA